MGLHEDEKSKGISIQEETLIFARPIAHDVAT
jgi:hypothetical protein